MTHEQADILALSGVPGIGARTHARLVARFGSPSDVFNATDRQLRELEGIGPVLVKNIRSFDRDSYVEEQKRLMDNCGAVLITRSSADYPPLLDAFKSAPPVLYVRGDVKTLSLQSLAFVGTRNSTEYGITMTRNLVGGTVKASLCIVSGMAAGIDSVAHREALDKGGKTVAVFGCGVDIIYPSQNRKLSEDIMQSGCLISHFPMGAAPLRGNFPARNAVIAGMSLGTVVVEAPKQSGALITADLTLKAGRKLFAVPGNATSMTSEGTNSLLARGAHPVFSIENILTVLGKPVPRTVSETSPVSPPRELPLLPGKKGEILKTLDSAPLQVDALCAKLGMHMHEVLSELTDLELDGFVRQKPGKIFERT